MVMRKRATVAMVLALGLAAISMAVLFSGAASLHRASATTPSPTPTVAPPTCPSGMLASFANFCAGPINPPSPSSSAAAVGSVAAAASQPTQQCGNETIPAAIACVILPSPTTTAGNVPLSAPSVAPSQVVATALDATEIEIDWVYPAAQLQSFVLLNVNDNPMVLGTVAASARSFRLSNLTPATQYCIAVYAYAPAGYSPPSAVVCATTPAV